MSDPGLIADIRQGLPSASAAERLLRCPGSWQAERTMPPEAPTVYADRGVRIHGAWTETAEDGTELAVDEADMVRRLSGRDAELRDQWLLDFEITEDAAAIQRITEQRYWLTAPDGWPGCTGLIFSGQVDIAAVAALDGDTLQYRILIVDGKSGWKTVPVPANNWQLRSLAVLMAESLGVNRVLSVRVAINQPLLKPQPPCDYDARALAVAKTQLLVAISLSREDNAKRIAGEWCEFCRARATCPEALALVKSLAPLPAKWVDLPPETKLDLYDRAKVAEKIIAAILGCIDSDLTVNPDAIPGLKRGPSQRPRYVADVLGMYRELLDTGIPKEKLDPAFTKICSMSIGDVVALLVELKQWTKSDADLWLSPGVLPDIIKTSTKRGPLKRT